jgi:hypothetical protein
MENSPAMAALEVALNAKRKEWYGDKWEALTWYGLPIVNNPDA